MNKILVIKHGSLGDIVFSLPVMHSINFHFKDKKIDLLTEKKYNNFLKESNFFDEIIYDDRKSNIFKTLRLLFQIIKNNYDLIIDLQNSTRTSYYNLFFRLFSKSKISSSRKFAHYRYFIPLQGIETTTRGLFNQLKLLNIHEVFNIKYNWLECKLIDKINNNIILFIPGVSARGKYKQWHPEKFAELAKYIESKNYQIILVGTSNDMDSVIPILKKCKNIVNKIDNSPPNFIYSIARNAKLVITNDTGPGHIAALSNSKILWIAQDNQVTKANIRNDKKNFKILSNDISDISLKEVINYIEKNNLL